MTLRMRGKRVTPGTMRKLPGRKSKSPKTQVGPKRWISLVTSKMIQAPKGLSPEKALIWAESETRKHYQKRSKKKG